MAHSTKANSERILSAFYCALSFRWRATRRSRESLYCYRMLSVRVLKLPGIKKESSGSKNKRDIPWPKHVVLEKCSTMWNAHTNNRNILVCDFSLNFEKINIYVKCYELEQQIAKSRDTFKEMYAYVERMRAGCLRLRRCNNVQISSDLVEIKDPATWVSTRKNRLRDKPRTNRPKYL